MTYISCIPDTSSCCHTNEGSTPRQNEYRDEDISSEDTANGGYIISSLSLSSFLVVNTNIILAVVTLWCTFPLVTLTTKCVLSPIQQCTKWGPNGAYFHHPLTVATLNLLLVGSILIFTIPLLEQISRRRRIHCENHSNESTIIQDELVEAVANSANRYSDDDISRDMKDRICKQDEEATLFVERKNMKIETPILSSQSLSFSTDRSTDKPTRTDKMRSCLLLGSVFGAKYLIAHWALQLTPAIMYELFHCLNIVFIVVSAFLVLGETLRTNWQILACVGLVLGSIVMTSKTLFSSSSGYSMDQEDMNDENGRTKSFTSIVILSLNIFNGIFAGLCVVFLRKTLLYSICDSIVEVTAFKMLSGGLILLPFALFIEGPTILSMTSKQATWIGLSSLTILLYHLALSMLCLQASSTTVGMIESLRPVPAFCILVAIQGNTFHKDWTFWFGSAIILISTVLFGVSKRYQDTNHGQNNSPTLTTRFILPNKEALMEWSRSHSRRSGSRRWSSWTNETEDTYLLDNRDEFDE